MLVENKQTFEIDVTRVGFGHHTISVQASSLKEAQELALDQAGNHLYNEHNSEYSLSDEPTREELEIARLEQRVTDLEELFTMTLRVNETAPGLLKPAAASAGDHEVTLPDFCRVIGASYLCGLLSGLKERGLVPSAEGIREIQTESRGDGFDLQLVKALDPLVEVALLELLFPTPEDSGKDGNGHGVHLICVKPGGLQHFSFIPKNYTNAVYAFNATQLKALVAELPHSTAILASLGAL